MLESRPQTLSDEDFAYAMSVIDSAFQPVLKRQLDVLNEFLFKRGIRAGIEINWLFDKITDQPFNHREGEPHEQTGKDKRAGK